MWLHGGRQILIYRLDACMFGVLAAWVKCFHPDLWQSPRAALPVIAVLICALITSLAVSLSDQFTIPSHRGISPDIYRCPIVVTDTRFLADIQILRQRVRHLFE